MLRVLVKVATFVNGAVHKAGEEIVIAEHHFSEEIHEMLEDLDPKPAAEPTPEPTPEPTSTEPPPAPATAAEVVHPAATSAEAPATEEPKP